MRDTLMRQDYLTTVVEQEADGLVRPDHRPLVDFLKPGDAHAIINRLADPAIRIVSLTVTEGGYYIDPASQRFDPKHPDIVHDAAHFDTPKTVFGLILAGLKRRRDVGIVPFTVMSCDNIPGNGHVTQNAVVGLAADLPRTGRLGGSQCRLPQRHGRPHHARHHRPRARSPCGELRCGRRLAGVLRALQAVGAGGSFPGRPAGARKGRRAVRGRRRAV
jgi:hypothetical protein